jgi:transposase
MPQMQLPMFPAGLQAINRNIGFQCESGKVVYFHGHLPVFEHDADDVQSFRLFTSQLIERGTVKQGEIVKSFGVPLITVKRYTKVLREKGSKGFFTPRKVRSAPVLTEEVLRRCQALLDEGQAVPAVAGEVKVLANTLHKAIRAGRLKKRN